MGTALTGRKQNYSFFPCATRLCTTPEAIGGRHQPWHYSNLSLTTNASLRVCRGSNYRDLEKPGDTTAKVHMLDL